MTPFKERMNLYRAYRELNPDKNYWDWKASVAEQDNDWSYQEWKRNLPENLRYESPDYDLYGAYKAGMQPTLESDGTYHLGSRDPQTGRILKRKGHPTHLMAIDAEIAAGYDVYEGDDGEMYSKAPLPNQDISGWLEFKDYYNSNELGAKERQQLRSWYRRRKAYAERTGNAELLEQLRDDGKTMSTLFGADRKMDSKLLGPYYFNVNLDNIPINVVDLSVLGKNIGGIYHVRHSSNPKGSIDIPNNYRSTDLLHEYTHALNSYGEPYDKTKTMLTDRDLLLVYPIGDDSYWLDPREVHSRLMELRHTHGISPLQKVTKEDLKKMRESGKSQHAILDYFADEDLILDLLNRVADAEKVQPATNSAKTDILATRFGGVIPAMQDGGENKPLQDPTIKTITFPDGSTIQTLLPWANQQGLLNTPVADMFNPANDAYDLVLVGKDATEGNWAGVGAGLALAMVPNAIEKPLRAVGRGIKKCLVKNVDEHVATVLPEPTTTAIARDVYAKDVHNYYMDDVFPRMIDNQGVHNSWIEYYAKNPDNFLYNVQPNTYFRNKNVSGRYTSITDEVALNEDFANTIHQKPTLVHENRHRLDSSIELTDLQTDLLRLAYKAQTGTSAADMREMVATNTEIRSIIYDAFDDGSGKLTPEFINNRIDAMPDYDLLDLVENVNVYGNQYSKNLRNQDGTINKKAIQNVRNALKYVPALAAPVMIHNTEDKSN